MPRIAHQFSVVVALALSAACGFTSPGSGTGTLEVQAILHFNPSTGGQTNPVTQAQVTVKKSGAVVSNPTVSFQDADSGQSYAVNAQDPNTGTLVQQIPGYHRRWIMTVVSGNDNLVAKLESPGPFALSAPLEGATVSSGGLRVNWQTQDGVKADKVNISLSGVAQVNTPPDSGSYNFPSSQLKLGSQTVQVIRINSVEPAGGTGSSVFQSDYEVDVNFLVQG